MKIVNAIKIARMIDKEIFASLFGSNKIEKQRLFEKVPYFGYKYRRSLIAKQLTPHPANIININNPIRKPNTDPNNNNNNNNI